mmetsp:Transcript_26581/g.74358  ORF Transcript_26581/g.74358 Transcript_26581/m.74358 type:complete len:111 (+) Transcript_26581:1384-1716(+)
MYIPTKSSRGTRRRGASSSASLPASPLRMASSGSRIHDAGCVALRRRCVPGLSSRSPLPSSSMLRQRNDRSSVVDEHLLCVCMSTKRQQQATSINQRQQHATSTFAKQGS